MENSAEHTGRLVAVGLFALLSLYFLVRGLIEEVRSRRLANLALFCGLTALVLPEFALGLTPTEQPGLFLVSGILRVVVGLVGIVLAVKSLAGREDEEVGMGRPIMGVVFSLFHVLAGGGLFMFGVLARPSTTWVYEPPDGAYRLTLPSPEWKQAQIRGEAEGAAFVRPVPRMQARVLTAKRNQTEADFTRTANGFRSRVENSPQQRGQAQFREGTNAAGNRYQFYTTMDSSKDGKPVFVAHSVTWCSRKQMVIEVIFEGLPTLTSQAGKATEMNLIEKSAETICLSVD